MGSEMCIRDRPGLVLRYPRFYSLPDAKHTLQMCISHIVFIIHVENKEHVVRVDIAKASSSCKTPVRCGFGYVQDWSAQNFVQDVCGQFLPCTSAQTNPTPGLTQTLWGARGRQGQPRGSSACFGCVFPTNLRAAEKPASTDKTRILHKVLRPIVLHMTCRRRVDGLM